MPRAETIAGGAGVASSAASVRARPGQRPPLVLYLVTEDWYFWSHRLPLARGAKSAGFRVAVATRVAAHGPRIEAEGFELYSLSWRRRGDGVRHVRSLLEIARLYRRLRPDIVHHVAMKPVMFGALAAAMTGTHRQVAAITGLGHAFTSRRLSARVLRWAMVQVMRMLVNRDATRVIVQNSDDWAVLAGSRLVAPERLVLIRGSGVDTRRMRPLPEPPGPVTVALVARMLRAKGVREFCEAMAMLRDRGLDVRALLVGACDGDSPDSFSQAELERLVARTGVRWIGFEPEVARIWQRAHVAVLPSHGGEGIPKSLLEAAAFGRPLVATDVAGCREIVRPGKNGLLVPVRNATALADAIAALALDPEMRLRFGAKSRALVEEAFDDGIVVAQTLSLYRAMLENAELA